MLSPEPNEIRSHVEKENNAYDFPFWAKLWPSAIALASFIQQQPEWVAGKLVAELAAGLGLPSLIAASYATQVRCSDLNEEAMIFAEQSARLHQIENIQFETCNWSNPPDDLNAGVVLLSDINYDPDAFEALEKFLNDLLGKGCTLLLATPQRLMAKPFIEKLLPFVIAHSEETVSHEKEKANISIFVLRQGQMHF